MVAVLLSDNVQNTTFIRNPDIEIVIVYSTNSASVIIDLRTSLKMRIATVLFC